MVGKYHEKEMDMLSGNLLKKSFFYHTGHFKQHSATFIQCGRFGGSRSILRGPVVGGGRFDRIVNQFDHQSIYGGFHRGQRRGCQSDRAEKCHKSRKIGAYGHYFFGSGWPFFNDFRYFHSQNLVGTNGNDGRFAGFGYALFADLFRRYDFQYVV